VAFPIYGMEVLLVKRVWPVLHPLSFVGLMENLTVVFYACEMISFWLFFVLWYIVYLLLIVGISFYTPLGPQ